MISPRTGCRRARLVAVWVTIALLLPLLAPTPARAAEVGARAQLTASDLSESRLSLSGTVTNTGSEPLREIVVDLWRSSAPLRTAEAIDVALEATSTTPGSSFPAEPANRVTLAPEDPLAPGASVTFTVSGTLAALGLTDTDVTWWVGVDVHGRTEAGSAALLAQARTLATMPDGVIPVAEVVEFSTRPRLLKKDLFLDDGLAVEVSTGRLAQLLDVAEERGSDWVIDPALVAELEDMADGYRLFGTTGTEAGSGGPAAEAWLARLDALRGRGSVGLFGTPDLAEVSPSQTPVLWEAVEAASGPTTRDLPAVTVVETPGATLVERAAALGRPVVAVDATADGAVVQVEEATAVIASTEDRPRVGTSLLPDTELTQRAVRFARARVERGEVRWIRSVEDLPPTDALPHGFRRASLQELAGAEPTGSLALPPPTGRPATVTPAFTDRVDALRAAMTTYAGAAPDSGLDTFVEPQTARSASRWWVDDTEARDAWLAAIEWRVRAGQELVSVDSSPRFSMTGDTSEFPVTVTNHLVDPVQVRLQAASDNPQRIRLTTPEAVEIAPGASNTVLLAAESAGGGVVRARVHAESLDGHRLTPDRGIVVETTNVGTIGWVLVIVSGIVLVATTARRIRQVRKHGKGENA